MKILHTGDIHLGELAGPIINGENARMQDTIRCMDYLTQKADEEQVDAILISGDLFHKSKLWADEMLYEITKASNWLRDLCKIAPVILMFGTANHDNTKAFGNIDNMWIPNLQVVTEPELLKINTRSGPLQVAALPGIDKGYFRAQFPGLSAEDENKKISEELGNIVVGLGMQAKADMPTILMAHYTVVGCSLDNGEQVFMQSDVVLPTASLAASNYDLICLGHIHRAQEVPNCGRPTYYCGSLNAITFNEEGQDKGFWIHEINADLPYDNIDSKFIPTPSRKFKTLEWSEQEVKDYIDGSMTTFTMPGRGEIKDAIVRLQYTCSDELNKQFNKKLLEKQLLDEGAFYVAEIKPKQIITTLDKNAMTENEGPLENLRLWLTREGFKEDEIRALMKIAEPMIATVSASIPSGKLTGVFEPVRLEVKNYRSYREESFDFTKVRFATVNGQNGIGKSAFFMDAIADCLYEEPREGELTGWITNDIDVKSGAITFEFILGDTHWRVVRTRVKSGKTTLNLSKEVDGQWIDCSEDKKELTQEKIVNLLGMDSMTFKSCALIMQDNYGLFLEADKSERMQVLGNILGLGIYENLTEIAKEVLREHNRKVEILKSEIAALDEKLDKKGIYEDAMEQGEVNKKKLEEQIQEFESEAKTLNETLIKLNSNKERIKDLTQRVITLNNEYDTQKAEKNKLEADIERANKIIAAEDTITTKIKEYEETKEQVTVLKTKLPQVTQIETELKNADSEIKKLSFEVSEAEPKIAEIENTLSNREAIENAAEECKTKEIELEAMDDLKVKYDELDIKAKELDFKGKQEFARLNNIENNLKDELKRLNSKVEMLKNSGCIDAENATCKFLADAIAAKERLPQVQSELDDIDKSYFEKLADEWTEVVKNKAALGYDSKAHAVLKMAVYKLKPMKEKALQLNSQAQVLETLKQQQEERLNKVNELNEKKTKLTMQAQTLQEELKPLKELEAKLPVLEKWYKGKDELPAAKQLITTASERLKVLENEILDRLDQIKVLETERDKLCEDTLDAENLEQKLNALRQSIKDLRDRVTNINMTIGGDKAKLEELEKAAIERQNKAKELDALAIDAVRYQTLVRAFGLDGIPFRIIRSVVQELGAQANEILGQMTGGKMAIEMKTERVQKSNKKEVNALEIWVTDYQHGTMPYKSRSGGQKVKAALSVAFALADLKAKRAGIQLGMMFIDEPPFLDKDGTQAYCDALELMSSRYPNMRVIAISHDPAMKARFPQEIEVIDSGDGSKIVFTT